MTTPTSGAPTDEGRESAERDTLNRRQREPIPYGNPWGDAAHQAKADAGLCYRLACNSVAHHGWVNTGVPGARYCLGCVRLLNLHNPGLCVPDPARSLATLPNGADDAE